MIWLINQSFQLKKNTLNLSILYEIVGSNIYSALNKSRHIFQFMFLNLVIHLKSHIELK